MKCCTSVDIFWFNVWVDKRVALDIIKVNEPKVDVGSVQREMMASFDPESWVKR